MKKTVAMLCTAIVAAVACADTWADPETGIEWTYTVIGEKWVRIVVDFADEI